MKMRKTLCFLIALALIAAVCVCGCGHSAPAAPSGSSGARSEEKWSGGTEPSSAGRQEPQSISGAAVEKAGGLGRHSGGFSHCPV